MRLRGGELRAAVTETAGVEFVESVDDEAADEHGFGGAVLSGFFSDPLLVSAEWDVDATLAACFAAACGGLMRLRPP